MQQGGPRQGQRQGGAYNAQGSGGQRQGGGGGGQQGGGGGGGGQQQGGGGGQPRQQQQQGGGQQGGGQQGGGGGGGGQQQRQGKGAAPAGQGGQQAPRVAAQGGAPAPGAPAPTPATPPSSMTKDQLMQMIVQAPPAQAKQILGERLYALIQQENQPLAGKITGMLLEGLDNSELVALIDDATALKDKIREALSALEAHAAQQQTSTAH